MSFKVIPIVVFFVECAKTILPTTLNSISVASKRPSRNLNPNWPHSIDEISGDA